MSFKDLYDGNCARILAGLIGLEPEEFAAAVDRRVGPLEMKDRQLVIAEELRARLGGDYETAVAKLVSSLPPEGSWALAPVARFVEEFGLDHPEVSLDAIGQITSRYTGEFAIRPYLAHHHNLTMARVREWRHSPNEHLRRLASEGIRPRLPWAGHYAPFKADPMPLIDVISPLIADPSKYVRTSVANNLNDVSKDDPARAVSVAREWLERSDAPETLWIVTKGLRTLIKRGDPGALALLGSEASDSVTIENVCITPRGIALGEAAVLEAEISNSSDVTRTVIVDYRMYFLKKNGLRQPTVFKLTKVTVGPGETVAVRKRHVFREVTTRVYYPGTQAVSVTANGAESEAVEFELRAREE